MFRAHRAHHQERQIVSDLEGNDPVLMEILFRLLYGVSEEKQDVIIARVPVDIRKQAIPNTNMGNYP